MTKFLIVLAEWILGYLREKNGLLSKELEEVLKRRAEHESRLAVYLLNNKRLEEELAQLSSQEGKILAIMEMKLDRIKELSDRDVLREEL